MTRGRVPGIGRGLRHAVLAVALLAVMPASGRCADATSDAFIQSIKPPTKKFLTISTGTATSIYQPIGSEICALINKQAAESHVYCSIRRSSGSEMNLDRLQAGTVNFAIAQSDQLKAAIDGTRKPGVRAFTGLRGVLALYPEQFAIIARGDAGVDTVLDLKGRVVDGAEPGSGSNALLRIVLDAYGLDETAFGEVTQLGGSLVSERFCTHGIDAFAILTGHPNPEVTKAIEQCGGRFVRIDAGARAFAVAHNPQLIETIIPPARYDGVDYEIAALGIMAVLVTTDATDPEIIDVLLHSVVSGLPALRRSHPVMGRVSPGQLLPQFNFLAMVPAAKGVLHD